MKILQAIAYLAVAFALACSPASAHDAGTSDQADMQMTQASRQQLIDTLIKEVNNRYVFPDMAKKVDQTLRAKQQRGVYDSITSALQLSEALTLDLQATTKDRHLRVMYRDDGATASKPNTAPTMDESARRLAMMRANNFGVEKVERLPFNIGYLELVGFMSAKDAADTLSAAMAVLAHTDALIIDLRKNGGGDAATVSLLASYLFDQRTHMNDFYYREGNRIEQRWSSDTVPGLRYGEKKAVYILTSKDTFSAAEDFTYALKNLKRATVVGETTGGGANPGRDIALLPHFSLFVPLGRSVSPITQSNWEGVGVTPDVSICAEHALKTAQLAILTKMAESEKDAFQRGHIKDRMAEIGIDHTAGAECLGRVGMR